MVLHGEAWIKKEKERKLEYRKQCAVRMGLLCNEDGQDTVERSSAETKIFYRAKWKIRLGVFWGCSDKNVGGLEIFIKNIEPGIRTHCSLV